MIKVYIDESGNLGRQGDYFVLGATVVKDEDVERRLRKIVRDETEREDEKRRGEVKFAKMKFKQRKRIIGQVGEVDVKIYYFTAYKPEVSLMGGETERNLIYNYFCRLLMQRVLKRYGDDYLIVFDKRTEAANSAYLGLKKYIAYIAHEEFPHLKNRTIDVRQVDSKNEELLQVADMVVGAAAQAYNNENLYFLRQLGEKIMMMDEFPKKRFRGGVKRLV